MGDTHSILPFKDKGPGTVTYQFVEQSTTVTFNDGAFDQAHGSFDMVGISISELISQLAANQREMRAKLESHYEKGVEQHFDLTRQVFDEKTELIDENHRSMQIQHWTSFGSAMATGAFGAFSRFGPQKFANKMFEPGLQLGGAMGQSATAISGLETANITHGENGTEARMLIAEMRQKDTDLWAETLEKVNRRSEDMTQEMNRLSADLTQLKLRFDEAMAK
jgi:hypothetical protein